MLMKTRAKKKKNRGY